MQCSLTLVFMDGFWCDLAKKCHQIKKICKLDQGWCLNGEGQCLSYKGGLDIVAVEYIDLVSHDDCFIDKKCDSH